MDRYTVGPNGLEAYSRPRSRKEFFKVLAAAGLATAAGASLATKNASAQAYAGAASDLEILNFAYVNESFEADVFYPAALNAGILSGPSQAVVAQLISIETAHRDAIAALITSLGGTLDPLPQFFVPDEILASEEAFLQSSLVQEQKDVGVNLAAAPLIHSPDVLAALAAISGTEGENLVAVKNLLGIVPPANEAFPQALPLDQAFAILAPFLAGVGTASSGASAGASSGASGSTAGALPATGGVTLP